VPYLGDERMDVYLYGFLVFDFTPPGHEPREMLDLHRLGVDNLSGRRELLAQFTMLLFARITDIPSPF
jgi:hypothetical protein